MDFEVLHRVQSDPAVSQFLGHGRPKSFEESKELFGKLLAHQERWGFTLSPCYEKRGGECIGFSGLVHLALDDESPDIELGYWLIPSFWGQGYASEIARGWVDWARNHLEWERVLGVTQPLNVRSQKVLRRVGFDFEGHAEYVGREVLLFACDIKEESTVRRAPR